MKVSLFKKYRAEILTHCGRNCKIINQFWNLLTCKELTNEDIYELYEDMKDNEEEDEDKKPTELTSKQLSELIQNFQSACDFTIDDIKCYTE